MASFQMYQN